MEITLFTDNIDIDPISGDSVQVTLSGVDVSQVIEEVGSDTLLSEMDIEEIRDFLNEYEDEEAQDE